MEQYARVISFATSHPMFLTSSDRQTLLKGLLKE